MSEAARHIILGMAGHIDHGKTALVKALTGIDTDRLKEEKERGMTTDLGFAFLGDRVAIIDVPGHERFVKTMVAGVTSVDMALLVIAADDGVMPQTREHLEIIHLLGIPTGFIALNKIDLADEQWREMVLSDIAGLVRGTMLEHAPIFPVSALTGEGIEKLRDHICRAAQAVAARRDRGVFRMPVDRVFTIKGFGTVAAGTIASGSVHVEEEVELLPQRKILRVRGIQVHDHDVTTSHCGLRTAVNLQSVEKDLLQRGDVLGAPGYFVPTSMFDVRLTMLASSGEPLKHRARVRVHVGTNEVTARLQLLDRELLPAGEEGFVQVHAEQPVVVDVGDRFVVRSYSPVRTIGGGVVLDVHPTKHRRSQAGVSQALEQKLQGDPADLVLDQLLRAQHGLLSTTELSHAVSLPPAECSLALGELSRRSLAFPLDRDFWCAAQIVESVKQGMLDYLRSFHAEHPMRVGVPAAELHTRIKRLVQKRVFDLALSRLLAENTVQRVGEKIGLADHHVVMTAEQEMVHARLAKTYRDADCMPPDVKVALQGAASGAEEVLNSMMETGELLRLEEGIIIHREAVQHAHEKVRVLLSRQGKATLSELRQYLGITRKYAVPLMTYFDALGVTVRDGETRSLGEGARS
jgi:selenocysteine-specific elongation factor